MNSDAEGVTVLLLQHLSSRRVATLTQMSPEWKAIYDAEDVARHSCHMVRYTGVPGLLRIHVSLGPNAW